jgi:hypothetical protein
MKLVTPVARLLLEKRFECPRMNLPEIYNLHEARVTLPETL